MGQKQWRPGLGRCGDSALRSGELVGRRRSRSGLAGSGGLGAVRETRALLCWSWSAGAWVARRYFSPDVAIPGLVLASLGLGLELKASVLQVVDQKVVFCGWVGGGQ